MPTTTFESSQSAPQATIAAASAATRQAEPNCRANLSALASSQPELADRLQSSGSISADWIFARDGYLTSRTASHWFTNCSVPMRAARQLLKKLELAGTLGCFLSPSHAAQLRAAFEKISPVQAILAIIPDQLTFQTLLHCDDFSAEISAGRLFFTTGPDWPDQLGVLFKKFPGLPLPQVFLRTALLDDAQMSDLSTEAQNIISRETTRRAERLPEILTRAQNRPPTHRILLLAGRRFNLADLSNIALRQTLLDDENDSPFVSLDPDNPLTASPLALAEAAADADALIIADVFRADLPSVVSPKTAWITWVTSSRIAAPNAQSPSDALLLADPAWQQAVLTAGWPANRIQIAGWPKIIPAQSAETSPPTLGLFTDTHAIEIPQKVRDFSSQFLLWEYIEEELSRDPLALGDDPDRYLQSRMQRLNIRDEAFDRSLFFDSLIVPAFKRGLALLLLKNGILLALFGRGWSDIPEFQSHSLGPIESIADLTTAVSKCHAIINPFPSRPAPIGALPLPTIQTTDVTLEKLLRRIKQALDRKTPLETPAIPPLTRINTLAFVHAVTTQPK